MNYKLLLKDIKSIDVEKLNKTELKAHIVRLNILIEKIEKEVEDNALRNICEYTGDGIAKVFRWYKRWN
jgi:hypothetical protein